MQRSKHSKLADLGLGVILAALLCTVFILSLIIGRYEIHASDALKFLVSALRRMPEDSMEYSIVMSP